MKAVVMVGGNGTRMRPMLARGINKHLVPVGGRPLIQHVLSRLREGGVTETLLLVNGSNPQLILEEVGTGASYGLHVYYMFENAPSFKGHDLLLAREWVGDAPFVLMLGDSVFFEQISFLHKHAPHLWIMPIEGLDDPRKYGQLRLQNNKVIGFHDKPQEPFGPYVQTGVWLYGPDVFERAATILSQQGELSLGALTSAYVESHELTWTLLPPCAYIDCGTPDAWRYADERLAKREGALL